MSSNICDERQVLYGIFAILMGISANWSGSKTMKIYDANKVEFFKSISITLFVSGTLLIAYGILSLVLRNNPQFCALTSF